MISLLLTASVLAATPFEKNFGTGGAELSAYALTQPRYGESRKGEAVMIWVTEPFSKSRTVKVDDWTKNPDDVVTVLKLNFVKKFVTGVYDYSLMTSVFSPLSGDPSPLKVSFSSQEWCGNVLHQLSRNPSGYQAIALSYFESEGDKQEPLSLPKNALLADELFFRARELVTPFEPGTYPLIPSLESVRLSHAPFTQGTVTVARAAKTEQVKVPAGTFETTRFDLTLTWGAQKESKTLWVEKALPHRIIAWEGDAASFNGNEPTRERAELKGSLRDEYWKHHGVVDEPLRKKLNLLH